MMMTDFASFWFSTLKISCYLEYVVSHKTLDMCVLRLISIILAEISSYDLHACMSDHLFLCHPYIESTTILSDNKNFKLIVCNKLIYMPYHCLECYYPK